MRTKRSIEGYLHIDHSNSPGLPADIARFAGYQPDQVGEGSVYECPTLGCVHCGAHVIMNPDRKRERGWCWLCDAYLCDPCAAAMKAGCEHRTIREIADLVNSGRWVIAGGGMSTPIIVPAGGNEHG